MPRKIGYTVVGVTGEAEGYSAKNLEHQSPIVPGWQTPRFCLYPQELILHLNETCRLKKLQILSHQYMIGSKVEFFVGMSESPESFKRLGYIYLSNNEKTGFKSRELKSVHIDAEGRYVRLVIHKNHLNKFNAYNQVGVMAFNVLGDPLKNAHRSLHHLGGDVLNMSDYLNEGSSKPDFISPMDDLAFDMYQDPEVAGIIRRLDLKKKEAVKDENFDSAKRMKQAIVDLQKVGEKLAKYELDKRRAIENEDYDLAKSKKLQMDEYRLKVYQQLQKHKLLEDAGISPNLPDKDIAPSPSRTAAEDPHQQTPSRVPSVAQHQTPVPRHSATPPVASPVEYNHQEEHEQQPVPEPAPPEVEVIAQEDAILSRTSHVHDASAVSYDEKVIPTLDKHKDRFLDETASPPPVSSPEQGGGGAPVGEPEPMSEKSMREARSVIDVFDVPLVSAAYSKMWSFREDALLGVYKLLSNVPENTPKEELRSHVKAAVFLVRKAIKDKVHAVYNAALKLLEMILVEFIPRHKLGKSETVHAVNHTLPALIHKTGETAARSRNSALDFIMRMSGFTSVHHHHLVPQQTTPPLKRDTANRLALSRVELLKKLLEKYSLQPRFHKERQEIKLCSIVNFNAQSLLLEGILDLEPPALALDPVMKFCVSALEHASGPVRDEATKVIFQVYRLAGTPVKSYLPPDDHKTRKNPLYRNLYDGFDKIDGKPTQAELKAQTQAEELKKKREIEELQAQVDHLRSVNKANEAQAQEPKQAKKIKRPANSKAQKEEVSPSKPVNSPPQNDDSFLDKMCIFCGERDDAFTDEGLDLHYWKHCPMLRRCEHCKQVVEIAGYSEHLMTECENKDSFGKCPRCSEAILKTELQKHISDKRCPVLKPNTQEHCPLCHRNIPQGEESWKSHLIGSKRDACPDNPRRMPSINRLRAKAAEQQKAPGAAKGKKIPAKTQRK